MGTARRLLVTHASGYVGCRLVRVLAERGEQVRCLARRPGERHGAVPAGIELLPGDALDPVALDTALAGVDTVLHLAHSMDATGHFQEQDRRAAENLARAAERAAVRRVVYLGVLGSESELSPHMASRREVGRLLRQSSVQTLELRAPNVLGPGSVAFEMLRGIVDRQRLLVAHSWLERVAQPIAIDDLLLYLVAAIDVDVSGSLVIEVGGRDRVSYRRLMEEYARQRGLRRHFLRLPVMAPRLSSVVVSALTPLSPRVARRLVDSIRGETVVASPLAARLFPEVHPLGMTEMIARAAQLAARGAAGAAAHSTATRECDVSRVRHGSRTRRVDARTRHVPVTPGRAFEPIRRIGGDRGWYYADWLWSIRGELDRLVGGPGLRRGRSSPDQLAPGDALDFWRVDAYEPDRLLRLRAEMRVPGRAWLQFEVQPTGDGGSRITQLAMFDPDGVAGVLYWYTLLPLHGFIFAGMLRRIGAEAVSGSRDE